MTTPRPENFPPELLAAYADGELSTEDRLRVERWLAESHEAGEFLETQEAMGPGNADLWDPVCPPSPSADDWIATRECIGQKMRLANRMRWAGWAGTFGVFATTATLMFVLPAPQNNCIDPEPPFGCEGFPVESIDDEPYPMASSADVQIISLPESAANLLVVGEHPLRDSFLPFARMSEVHFHNIGTDLAGRFPEVMNDAAEDVLPMLWAPREP